MHLEQPSYDNQLPIHFIYTIHCALIQVICDMSLNNILLEPSMQKIYNNACQIGVRKVYRSKIMLVGHFAAGKTSVTRSLLHEPFEPEHLTTIGIETQDQDCTVDVNSAVNWRKGW